MNPITILLRAVQHSSVGAVFSKAGGYIQQFRSQINSSLMSTISAAAMAQKAIGMVTSEMSKVTGEAKKFQQQGARLGIDPAEVAKLNKLSDETGTSTRAIFKGFNQIKGVAAQALADPTSEAAQTMKQLGISTQDLENGLKNPTALFGKVSDSLNNIGDEGQKMEAMTALFKANAAQLAGIVDAGAEGQKKLMDGNSVQTGLMIGQNAAMKDAWEKFWDAISVGFASLGVVLNPVVQIIRVLLNILSMVVKVIGGGAFAAFEAILGGILWTLGKSVEGWGMLGKAIGGVIKHIPGLGKAGEAMESVGEGTLEWGKNIQAGGVAMFMEAGKTLKATGKGIVEDAVDIKDSVVAIGDGYGDGNKGGKSESGTYVAPKTKAEQDKTAELKRKREEALADLKREGEIVDANERKKADALAAFKASENELQRLKDEAVKKATAGGKTLTDIEYQQLMLATEATDAYLEADTARLNAKKGLLAVEREIANEAKKAAEELAKKEKARADSVAKEKSKTMGVFQSVADQIRERGMKAEGKSDAQIKAAKFKDTYDLYERQKKEYADYVASVGGEANARNTVTGQQMRGELGKTMGNVLTSESEMNQAAMGSKLVKADNMAKIGGGGAVASSNAGGIVALTKEQLAETKLIREAIVKMAERDRASQSSFDTLREKGLTGATAAAALESDNSP
jgi:hypothetical protein